MRGNLNEVYFDGFIIYHKGAVQQRFVDMQSTSTRHSVHAKPSKVKNDVLDSLMANHILHPVHLVLKFIYY